MEVRAVQIRFLVPRCRWQDDVRVERRGIHAEIQVDDEIHLAYRRDFVPLHLLRSILAILADGIGMSAEVVLEGVFVALHASHDGVATPDVPNSRIILFRFRIGNRILQFPGFKLFQYVLNDVGIIGRTVGDSFGAEIESVLLELRIERHPAVANRHEDGVCGMLASQVIRRNRVVTGVLPIIAVLAAVDVMP